MQRTVMIANEEGKEEEVEQTLRVRKRITVQIG
jgi:hypothetical protein